MELRHLRYFLAVAEELNFRRAAQRLHVSQPPLSQQIHQLEEELGTKLFDRLGRKTTLTQAGKILMRQTRVLLAHIGETKQLVAKAGSGDFGQLRVGFLSPFNASVVMEISKAFMTRYPDVRVALLHRLTTLEQIDALRENHLDVGFLRLPADASDCTVEVVAREPHVLAMPADHPLAEKASLPLRSLANQKYIFFPRLLHPDYYDSIVILCRNAGIPLNIAYEQPDVYSTLAMVAAGRGVSLQPASVQEIAVTGVVYRKVQPPFPFVELAVAYRPQNQSIALARFVEIAKEVGRRLSPVALGEPPVKRVRSSRT